MDIYFENLYKKQTINKRIIDFLTIHSRELIQVEKCRFNLHIVNNDIITELSNKYKIKEYPVLIFKQGTTYIKYSDEIIQFIKDYCDDKLTERQNTLEKKAQPKKIMVKKDDIDTEDALEDDTRIYQSNIFDESSDEDPSASITKKMQEMIEKKKKNNPNWGKDIDSSHRHQTEPRQSIEHRPSTGPKQTTFQSNNTQKRRNSENDDEKLFSMRFDSSDSD